MEQSSEEASSVHHHHRDWEHGTNKLKVDYETALELVLSASTEYFNSAANLTDPSMELARYDIFISRDDRSWMNHFRDVCDQDGLL